MIRHCKTFEEYLFFLSIAKQGRSEICFDLSCATFLIKFNDGKCMCLRPMYRRSRYIKLALSVYYQLREEFAIKEFTMS